jgi:hypothetical protein
MALQIKLNFPLEASYKFNSPVVNMIMAIDPFLENSMFSIG